MFEYSKQLIPVFENLPAIIILLDGKGTVLKINPYFTQITGFSQEEAIGKNWIKDFIPPEEQNAIQYIFNKAFQHENFDKNINSIKTKDGKTRIIQWTDPRQIDPEEKTLLAAGIDITERQKIRETLERQNECQKWLQKAGHELLSNEKREEDIILKNWIEQAGAAADADQAYFFEIRELNSGSAQIIKRAEFIHNASVPGNAVFPQSHPLPMHPNLKIQLEKGHPFQNHAERLPEPERSLLLSLGVKSILLVPLIHLKKITNYLGFYRFREQKEWSSSEMTMLSNAAADLSLFLDNQAYRKHLETEIERFSCTMNMMDTVVYVADMSTYEILFLNEKTHRTTGAETGQICYRALQKGQTKPCSFCTNNRLLDEKGNPGPPIVWEFQNTVDGEWYVLRDQAIPWPDGRIVRMEIASNITARKKNEEHIRQLLETNRMLIKEIHHRDKNNMNAVKNLLLLQSNNAPDAFSSEALKSAVTRMESMNVLYDTLYQTEQFEEISSRCYFDALLERLQTAFACSNILLKTQIEEFTLPVEKLNALGLMVNEMVTNTYKYAFEPEEQGELRFILRRVEKEAVLELKDNGRGYDPENPGSGGFGLTLIELLAEQLEGKLEKINERGMGYRLVFPL